MTSSYPAMDLALAMAAGATSQAIARHLRIPGIVLLLGAGVGLGPEGLSLIEPARLGSGLHMLVGFAVAVILFEGGLNLDLARLRREARTIQLLISVGAIITALGAAMTARWILGWPWSTSVLFGTLVIVTGPTVVTPLLRRLKVNHKLSTVLDAEGVLIDPVGAIIAVVTLELAVAAATVSLASGIGNVLLAVLSCLAAGGLLGLLGGLLLGSALRAERAVPEGIENIFTLSWVFLLFQASDYLYKESGIVAVTVAGLVVGNMRTRVHRELSEFKEQLTVLLIGVLFVLLAADVQLADVRSLGLAGVATVLVLMLVVRPINILACTAGSNFTWREKAFLGWLAPRGIVAAAVASLFNDVLDDAGIPGGPELRALVFLVIATTVVVQGLSGGWIADWLGVRRPSDNGYVILGANGLSLALGHALQAGGQEVVYLDSNPRACHVAETSGFKVLFGNGLEESTLQRAEVDGRRACIGLSPNAEINFLFARRCRRESKEPRLYVGLRAVDTSVTATMVQDVGCSVLFGAPIDPELWAVRFARRLVELVPTVRRTIDTSGDLPTNDTILLPLAEKRAGRVRPMAGEDPQVGDEVMFAMLRERSAEGLRWLAEHGYEVASVATDDPATDDPAAG